MSTSTRHADEFARAFDAAFGSLQVRVEEACRAEKTWATRIAAGIRAALAFAAEDPASAQTLTNEAFAHGPDGFARYERIESHFGQRLLPGRRLRPEGERLPEVTEKAMVSGLAMLIAQRLDLGREAELPGAAAEVIQFVLTPYLGTEEARRLGAEVGQGRS